MRFDAKLALAGIIWLITGDATLAAPNPSSRILIKYEKPSNPDHGSLYDRVQERRVLEKIQEVFSPFRLPTDLTIKITGCDGVSNAWYHRPEITICYEYLDDIRRSIPNETTPAGVTPTDALVGQFFYVVAHEFGHAVFDMLRLPSFGNSEDIADQFSTYIMLHFGKTDAKRLIAGAAYSYKSVLASTTAFVPLKAFSDIHGLPAQRLFNLLCLAYGADPETFAEIVEDKFLPPSRAGGCRWEYGQVAFAFQHIVGPHIDQELAEKVFRREWLPRASP
jgi:hypothetical protein